jgi:hypothetical protein
VRFAYADPPYLGCGASHYGEHHPDAADWDEVATHEALADRLMADYPDGWALSLNPRDLTMYLNRFERGGVDVRVAAWCKTWHQIRPTTTQFSWEPVIFRSEKKLSKRPMVRDWMACAVTRQKGLKGAKPEAFCRWVADLIGYEEGDEMDDLFPGTGVMGRVLNQGRFSFAASTGDTTPREGEKP